MTRTPIAYVLTALLAAAPLAAVGEAVAASEADKGIAFDAPEHPHYFRYQDYLNMAGLEGKTAETWEPLDPAARREEITRTEAFLRRRFKELIAKENLSDDEKEFLEEVWGENTAKGAIRLAAARRSKDPRQIALAMRNVADLAQSLGGVSFDWGKFFDRSAAGGAPFGVVAPTHVNYLRPEEPSEFLASLDTPEIRDVLASRDSFAAYLTEKSVPPGALPGLMAMYQVIGKANAAEKAEIGHLLPTIVRFLADGKTIEVDEETNFLGYAVSGEYDRPQKVAIGASLGDNDPITVASVFTHEFQHIYDMYAGRYYTLDSEMRGFKAEVIFFDAMRREAAGKYASMLAGLNDSDRVMMRDVENYSAAYHHEDPEKFATAVAFGHGYSRWNQGTFFGRFSLRHALDPMMGAPRELAGFRVLRDDQNALVARFEADQARIRLARAQNRSRELDRQLEMVTKDLARARQMYAHYDKQVSIKELRIARMASELAWLDAKNRGMQQPYDLYLPVDGAYVTP